MTSQRKKETYLTIKNPEFFKVEKGLIQAFDQKNQILLYLDLAIIRLEKLLSHFAEKKETCFDYKKTEFFKVQKIHFSKGVNPCFWSKNANYLVYLDLVKIRLEIMLSDFAEKKETFLTIKNNFLK